MCIGGGWFTSVGVLLGTEGVDTQWGSHDAVGNLDSLVEIVNGEDRNQRTKALLDQHGVVGRIDLDDSRLNKELLFIHSTSGQNLALGVINHSLEPVEVALVDDSRIVRRRLRALRIEFLVRLLELLNDSRYNGPVNQKIVLRRTDLARVHDLGP